MDFKSDQLFNGRFIRVQTIVDVFCRRSPVLDVRQSDCGSDAGETLERFTATARTPCPREPRNRRTAPSTSPIFSSATSSDRSGSSKSEPTTCSTSRRTRTRLTRPGGSDHRQSGQSHRGQPGRVHVLAPVRAHPAPPCHPAATASRRPSRRSAAMLYDARTAESRARCAYRAVVSTCVWPSRRPIIGALMAWS